MWVNPNVYIMKIITTSFKLLNYWGKKINTELKVCRKIQSISKRYKMS